MSETWPFVSVIIPMRNEAGHVAACLESVLVQEYPRDRMEVIVVDGESDDATATIARQTGQRDPRVRVLTNPGRIVPTAMNIGIRSARGEIIARVDGHTRIAADYVRVGVETLRRTGADNVGGPMRAVGGGRFGDAVATATSSRFGIGSYFHFGTRERAVDTVYMGMWPRRVFERVGLFDEELVRNQDDELSYRIRKEGGRIVLTPAMRSWYQNRQSIRHLTRQYFQYGLWKIRVLQKHPRQMSWRHFVPPAFVAALCALSLLALGSPAAGAALGALVTIYAAAVLAVSAVHSLRRGVVTWLATALAFIAIHLCWGAGFLAGLFKFAGRWWRPEPGPSTLERGDGSPGGALQADPAGRS